MTTGKICLEVANLTLKAKTGIGHYIALQKVSFSLAKGERVALLGGPGAGKSLLSGAVYGWLPEGVERVQGKIRFQGKLLLRESDWKEIRQVGISLVPEEPDALLNPSFWVGVQISEMLQHHLGVSSRMARKRALRVLGKMGIPDPERIYRSLPSALSGTTAHRVSLAVALCCEPRVLILDEPFSNLSLPERIQLLKFVVALQELEGFALCVASEDIGLVAEFVQRGVVLEHGQVVEQGPIAQLLDKPVHPSTNRLIQAALGARNSGTAQLHLTHNQAHRYMLV